MTLHHLQRRNQIKQRMRSPLALIVLFVFAMLILRGAVVLSIKARNAYFLAERSLAERQRLMDRREDLESKIKILNTEFGMESELRARFGVALPNEEVAVIIDPKNSTSTDSSNSKKSWWRKLWPF